MEAQLHVAAMGPTTLYLPISLKVPCPQHHILRREQRGFSYRDKVLILVAQYETGPVTTIQTLPGTGDGQAEAFDALVGESLAEARQKLARKLRVGGQLGVTQYRRLRRQDVERIQDAIEVHRDGLEEDRFVWRDATRQLVFVTDESFSDYLQLR